MEVKCCLRPFGVWVSMSWKVWESSPFRMALPSKTPSSFVFSLWNRKKHWFLGFFPVFVLQFSCFFIIYPFNITFVIISVIVSHWFSSCTITSTRLLRLSAVWTSFLAYLPDPFFGVSESSHVQSRPRVNDNLVVCGFHFALFQKNFVSVYFVFFSFGRIRMYYLFPAKIQRSQVGYLLIVSLRLTGSTVPLAVGIGSDDDLTWSDSFSFSVEGDTLMGTRDLGSTIPCNARTKPCYRG